MIGFKKNPADVVFGIRSYAYCHNTRLNAYVSLEQGNRPPSHKDKTFRSPFHSIHPLPLTDGNYRPFSIESVYITSIANFSLKSPEYTSKIYRIKK